VLLSSSFSEGHWGTYDIDTTVPRNRNDGIQRSEIYADNCAREEKVSMGIASIACVLMLLLLGREGEEAGWGRGGAENEDKR
jgi:hypothetical protein